MNSLLPRPLIELSAELSAQLKQSCTVQNIVLHTNPRTHRQLVCFAAALAAQNSFRLSRKNVRLIASQLDPSLPVECVMKFNTLECLIFSASPQFSATRRLSDETTDQEWELATELGKQTMFHIWYKQTQLLFAYLAALTLIVWLALEYSLAMAAFMLWLGGWAIRRWAVLQKIVY